MSKFSWALILFLTLNLRAQTTDGTNGPARPLSLPESIQLALEHNLNLQIQRFTPEVARFTLEGSYSYYDPTFKLTGRQDFTSSPGRFNTSVNQVNPPADTWAESFRAHLTGNTPSGMNYDLGADLVRTSGRAGSFGTNGLVQIFNQPFQYSSDVSANFTQPLLKNLWTDSFRTQIKVNKSQLKFSELGLVNQIMDTVTKVQQAYYDLIFARENVKVQEKALELAERLLTENKKRVQVGTMAPLDEKQAQSQAATARADLISARNQLSATQNILKNLLTDDYSKWHDLTLDPSEALLALPETFNLAESWRTALKLRPDYNQLKEQLEQQNIILKFRHNQLFPELDLVGTVGRNGLANHLGDSVDHIRGGDNPFWGGGATLTIPLTFRGDRNNYRVAKAQQKQAVLQLKQLEQTIVVQIDDAVKLAQSNFERVDATRQARLFAEAALEAEQKKLESGKSTSFNVLQLQRDLTTARSNEIRALSEYNKSLFQLYFDEGTTLDRNRISVQVK